MRNDEKRLAPLVGWDVISADEAERLPATAPYQFTEALAKMRRAESALPNCTPSRSELFDAWGYDGPAREGREPPMIVALVFGLCGLSIGISVVWGLPALFGLVGRLIAAF
jgi:hypothetical protein